MRAREVAEASIENLSDIYRSSTLSRYENEILASAIRVLRSGAKTPLTFIGMGAYGVVFCDGRGRGYKAARRPDDAAIRHGIEDEAEWLRVASSVPYAKDHVARFVAYYPKTVVIERQCIVGSSYRSRAKVSKWDTHHLIGKAMAPYGYGAPEFKEDSYVWDRSRGWVLVDASMAHKYGARLAAQASRALAGQKRFATPQEKKDIAWALRMEAGRTIAPERAERMSERLVRGLKDLPW